MRILVSLRAHVSYHKSGLIRASESVIYKVISQTQKYPQFIPWVNSSKIIKPISPFENITKLNISYNSFKQLSYSSHVKMHPSQKPGEKSWVHSVCHDAPLKKLDSLWEIQAKDQNSAMVDYKLNFQFSSPLYQLASSVLKDYMGEQMWHLFQKQALTEQVKIQRQRRQVAAKQQSERAAAKQTQKILNSQQNIYQTPGQKQPKPNESAAPESSQTNPVLQQCKILKLSHFLDQNPQLKHIYCQSTSNRSKIEQLHVRLQPMPDYQSQMERQIRKLVAEVRVQNSKV